MLKTRLKLATALAALFLSTSASAQNAAVVNGQALSSNLLNFIVQQQVENNGQPASDELRSQIREKLVQQEVLRQEAIRKGLEKSDNVKYQNQMMERIVLANALHTDFMKNTKLSDEEVQKTYNELTAQIKGDEYRASHILVAKEQEAKDIIAKLDKGANFAALAKASSKDPGSAAAGGDLDWANAQVFVPEFSNALTKLKKGQYTKKPVQSQFGFHVILLTDKREAKPPALDTVRTQIEQEILNRKWQEYLNDLTTKAKIQ